MKVVVDTSVWSPALRRDQEGPLAPVKSFNVSSTTIVSKWSAIRQEVLSGIRTESQFEKLRKHLESFPDLPLLTEDYVAAAQFFNQCRSKGIQGSNTDFLICAVAVRNKFSIYTTDKDFKLFSKYLQIALHKTD